MSYITFATLLLVVASGIFSFYHQLRALQQNSYSLSGYLKWIKEGYTTQLAASAVFYAAITLGIIKNKAILALVLSIVLAFFRVVINRYAPKKEISKLAFTVRAKILYVAAIVILGALALVAALSSNVMAAEVCRTLCLMLSIVTPALAVIVWGVTYPIEKVILLFKKG